MSYVVYGLEDPRDRLYHYVGFTDDVYARFIQHIKGSSGNLEKNSWIFECRQNNVMIAMRELERIDVLTHALEREEYWIRHYLVLGHPLNNVQLVKTLLKEQAKLERLTQESVKIPVTTPVHIPKNPLYGRTKPIPDMQQAFEMYQEGMSYRVFARVLGVNKDRAGEYIRRLRDLGMIA